MKRVILIPKKDVTPFLDPSTRCENVKRIQYVWWFGRWIVLTYNDGRREIYNRKYYEIRMIIE